MAFAGEFRLPQDVVFVPVEELPAEVRAKLPFEKGDYALTRPRSRMSSRIIDARAAEFVREFARPTTLVQAIIRFAQTHAASREETLDEAYPLLEQLLAGGFLVADGASEGLAGDLRCGDVVGRWEIVATIQVMDDNEVHQVRDGDRAAVLKIERPGAPQPAAATMREREALVLSALDGAVAPRLLEAGVFEERPFLAIEWCRGIYAGAYAEELRRDNDRVGILELCRKIAAAYATLHAHGYSHGDVHPNNVLVGPERQVRLIDFGLAAPLGRNSNLRISQRPGVAFFFEPEFAAASLRGEPAPAPNPIGEQYAVGALLYSLVTGMHYADFSLERETMLRQIITEPPQAFSAPGVAAWPQLEAVLKRALAKSPEDRFSSMEALAAALGNASLPREGRRPPASASPARSLLAAVAVEFGVDGTLARQAPTAPTASLFFGAGGIACGLYRLSILRDSAADLAAADLWLTRAEQTVQAPDAFLDPAEALTAHDVDTTTPFHTASGLAAVRTLIANAQGDVAGTREAASRFVRLALETLGDGNPDLTMGRSGVLLAAALLGDVLGDDAPERDRLASLGGRLLESLWSELDSFPPLALHVEPPNLGMAHGWCGYAYAALRFCHVFKHPLPQRLYDRIDELAGLAEPWGRGVRWRWNDSSRTAGSMPGWCNGSAGFVHLFTLAHREFADERFLDLATGAAWNAWEGGDGNGSLCCGEAGRAYALLALSRHVGGDAAWLARAGRLADRAAAAIVKKPEKADSLFKGKIGVALLRADLDRPEASAFPFLEAEGWRDD